MPTRLDHGPQYATPLPHGHAGMPQLVESVVVPLSSFSPGGMRDGGWICSAYGWARFQPGLALGSSHPCVPTAAAPKERSRAPGPCWQAGPRCPVAADEREEAAESPPSHRRPRRAEGGCGEAGAHGRARPRQFGSGRRAGTLAAPTPEGAGSAGSAGSALSRLTTMSRATRRVTRWLAGMGLRRGSKRSLQIDERRGPTVGGSSCSTVLGAQAPHSSSL